MIYILFRPFCLNCQAHRTTFRHQTELLFNKSVSISLSIQLSRYFTLGLNSLLLLYRIWFLFYFAHNCTSFFLNSKINDEKKFKKIALVSTGGYLNMVENWKQTKKILRIKSKRRLWIPSAKVCIVTPKQYKRGEWRKFRHFLSI